MATPATLRLVAIAVCCALPLSAQETEKPTPPAEQPATGVATETIQELEQKPAPAVVQDPVAAAKQQLTQMQRELEFLRQVADSGLVSRVRARYLGDRTPSPRTMDLGVPAAVEPAAPAATQAGARLMSDEERATVAEGVVLLVEGEPVTEAEIRAMADHFRTRPGEMTDDAIEAESIRSLVTQKAALARFRSGAPAARQKIDELAEQLANGEDFAAVAKQHSMCPSAPKGGDLGSFGINQMVPMFERAAFATPVGEVSDVVQTEFGYHIVNVTARDDEKGEVRARHILITFDRNMEAISQVMTAARQGRVDIAFVDAEWKARSPF